MKTQEELERDYLKSNGSVCPHCDSRDITGGSSGFDGDIAWMNVVCDDCGKEWTDVYTLTGVTFM